MKQTFFLFVCLIFFMKDVFGASHVHILGDSHAYFCFNNSGSNATHDERSVFAGVPWFIHWLGSRTMYRVGRDGLKGLDITGYNIHENDIAVFLFGEVDVRCHIGKQRDEKGRKEEEVIDTLVHKYIQTITANKLQYKSLTCVVASIVPPSDQNFNSSYPYYGVLNERVRITREINKCLQKYCLENEILFLDIYSLYAKNDGSLNELLSDGIVHVNPKKNKMIKEKLMELISKN